jgi:hypothetical protein
LPAPRFWTEVFAEGTADCLMYFGLFRFQGALLLGTGVLGSEQPDAADAAFRKAVRWARVVKVALLAPETAMTFMVWVAR